MPDFILRSLRGGLNERSPLSLAEDQCTEATNVEWVTSELGERRRGATAIDLTGSVLAGADRITFLHRHLPSIDVEQAELWAFGVTDAPPTGVLAYKDTIWHTVAPVDAIDPLDPYTIQGQTLHGKLFLAYRSGVDRLHVWDGTSLRRAGLAEPDAPTVSNTGSGSFTGTRYYRVRYTVQSGGTTVIRSEPSETVTFTPSGSGAAARVTKPASIGENETHWEIEASVDRANFYRIATQPVGTTTYDDSVDYSPGYGVLGFTLAEDVGDYSLIPSARFLTVDEDRLIWAGSFEDNALSSRVGWTPVFGAGGVGNDERLELDADPFVDLDTFEGGPITGLSDVVNGYFFATKLSRVYQFKRRGVRTSAYEATLLTTKRGALPGSLVTAFDAGGNPAFFCLDPDVGPCIISGRGVQPCGLDLPATWRSVNLDASSLVCRGLYYPEAQQIHWWIATGDSPVPNLRLVLHVAAMLSGREDEMRRGWARWTGPSSEALAVCLFSDNIDAQTFRSRRLVPFVGVAGNGLIWRTDTGSDDNGTDYQASMTTRPFVHGNVLHQFESKNGAIIGAAATGASVVIRAIGNFGTVSKEVGLVDFTPASGEGDTVIRTLDNLSLSELRTLQVQVADGPVPGERWELSVLALREEGGQRA